MVDADVPATYRLPPVQVPVEVAAVPLPLFSAPLAPPVTWVVPAVVDAREAPTLVPAKNSTEEDREVAIESGEALAVETPAPQQMVAEAKPQAAIPAVSTGPKVSRSNTSRTVDLTSQLLPAVQRGFGLAQRGALFAARTEFVQVLRRVAQTRDAAAGGGESSRALAAGLRALDEADDFVPSGVQLEAELNVRTTASSHRTNVLPEVPEEVSPSQAVDLYHEFARYQLATAVGHEQAGSMALHGLGTIHARLAARKDEDVQHSRTAMTMYSAALDACPNNHLAANELGVLVCRSGRADEAAALFKQAIDFAPSAVAYHNLAIAQQRGGRKAEAAANELESQRLAAQERARGDVSRRAGVRWVTPEEMARASQPIHRTATPGPLPAPQSPGTPPEKSPWRRVVDSARSLPLPGGQAKDELGPMPVERVARPMGMDAGSQRQWR
jgi:tetratricopeptide (TPR) repeat protein